MLSPEEELERKRSGFAHSRSGDVGQSYHGSFHLTGDLKEKRRLREGGSKSGTGSPRKNFFSFTSPTSRRKQKNGQRGKESHDS